MCAITQNVQAAVKVNEDGCRRAPVVSESTAFRSCGSNVILGIIIMLLVSFGAYRNRRMMRTQLVHVSVLGCEILFL